MKFQKSYVILVIFIILSVGVGCTLNKEKKIEEIKEEISVLLSEKKYDEAISKYDEILSLKNDPTYINEKNEILILKYKDEALLAREDGNLEGAIEIYNKILSIKDSEEIKLLINDVKEELEAVEITKDFYEQLYTIQKERLRSGIEVRPTDMEYIIKDLRVLRDKFESIDDSKPTDIARHVKKIKDMLSYKLFVNELNSKVHDNSGLAEALGKFDSQLNLLNSFSVAFTRNILNDFIDDLMEMKIPDKYK